MDSIHYVCSCVLISYLTLTLKLRSTWSYQHLKFEWFMFIQVFSYGFYFYLLSIYVKERKMKNWKKVLAKKPKDDWSSHVTGNRYVSKYRNRRATKLLWAMRQRKYFGTKNKNNLDLDSYVWCRTQRNCKGWRVM